MGTINLGKIKPLYKGDYSGSVTYKVLDFVRYNNSLYVCKLDSIGNLPTNTTYFDNAAYLQTPSEILTSIKTVDGTGSGLDADLLDGLHSSSFMQKISSTDNAIVRFDGTTGAVQNSGVTIDDNGNVGIGTTSPEQNLSINGTSGISLMNTSFTGRRWNFKNEGSLYIGHHVSDPNVVTNALTIDGNGNIGVGVAPSAWGSPFLKAIETNGGAILSNGGNTMDFWQNAYYNGSQSIYRNTGVSAGRYVISGGHTWYVAPSGTAGNPITWTNAMTLDTSGNLTLNSGTGALGYGTGAGGTVTQLTSKSTAVTLNKPSGKITMNNAALAAGASVSFWVANNLLDYTKDLVAVAIEANNNYRVEVEYLSSDVPGQLFSVRVTNISASSRSDALGLHFAIIKGAVA